MHKALPISLLISVALNLTGGCPNPDGSGGMDAGGTTSATGSTGGESTVRSFRTSPVLSVACGSISIR